MRSTTSFFPDINVWLAIVVERHAFNRAAAGWWNEDGSGAIGFCRFTQLGLLRHLTNPATMSGKPLTNGEAWKVYETLHTDPRVRVLPEWPALDSLFQSYSTLPQAAPKIWGDAYLAAYAAVNDATIVTFDRGFTRYPVSSLILEQR